MKALILLLCLACPLTVLANGGGYDYGTTKNGGLGVFQPKNAEQIEMQTEVLGINLGVEHAHVEVEYRMHNPGKSSVTVEAAFPCTSRLAKTIAEGGTPPLDNFAISVDGTALKHRVVDTRKRAAARVPAPFEETRPVDLWYAFKLDFKPGQTRTFKASYDTAYAGSTMSISDTGGDEASTLIYLFSSAAVWKGPIRSGKVTITAGAVDPDQVKFNLSKRFKRKGNAWTWEFADFEPTTADDLKIEARPKTEFQAQRVPGAKGDDSPWAQMVKFGDHWEMEHCLYKVTASSTLEPAGELNYVADNIRNYEGKTWAEGAPGDGIGESLTLKLDQPRKISHIGLLNGYIKARGDKFSAYYANNRVAELGVSINGGKAFSVNVPDEPLAHSTYRIPLPADAGEVKTVQLTIQKVYRGTKYRDTCISGVRLITPLAKKPKITPVR